MTEGRQSRRRRVARAFSEVVLRPGEDLVAVGGTLDPAVVLDAYRHGCFPWFEEGSPPLWWSPDPRAVLPLEAVHVPRRLERTIRTRSFDVEVDRDFEGTMRACAEDRSDGTWIHEDMVRAYVALHRLGFAHSLEVRAGGRLVGGTYGVRVGAAFAAESMFHRVRDASKVALVALTRRLCERGFVLLDVQMQTPHLRQFGVREIPRDEYLARLREALRREPLF